MEDIGPVSDDILIVKLRPGQVNKYRIIVNENLNKLFRKLI